MTDSLKIVPLVRDACFEPASPVKCFHCKLHVAETRVNRLWWEKRDQQEETADPGGEGECSLLVNYLNIILFLIRSIIIIFLSRVERLNNSEALFSSSRGDCYLGRSDKIILIVWYKYKYK